ncbi:MAG: polymer-forming cytoskeletal protein [Rhodocyclaceae bacterium]|nr:polymer-forming cytoskeletal protein [Rhodocyclaceae bacterium]
MFRVTKTTENRIDSLIGAGTRIEGNVVFSGGLRIDGEVIGDIRVAEGETGVLVVSEHASVRGAVNVTRLIVNGVIEGPVEVTEFAELQPKAKVRGDLSYATIEIQLGAIIEGRLIHRPTLEAGT